MAVYIIKHPDASESLYKIGKANQPAGRFGQLATGYVSDIKNPWFIYPTSGEDFNSGKLLFIEKQIHKLYAAERVRHDREFFRFDDVAHAMSKATAHINALGIPCKLTHDLADVKTIDTRSYLPEEYKTTKKAFGGRIIEQPVARPYQIEIAELLSDWHHSHALAGKIILPPGIGKTYIAAQYIARFKPASVLIITPQIMICDGFAEVLRRYGLNPRVAHSESNPVVESAGITIVTYQGAVMFDFASNVTFDLVIYDEAHHTCAAEYGKTRAIPTRRRLYLTATEKIFDSDDQTAPVCMSHESYGPTIARMDIKEAVTAGLLCDYQIYMSDWTLGLGALIEQLTKQYLRKRLVLYFNTISHAQSTADDLGKLGFDACCIHSGQRVDYKKQQMTRFRSDQDNIMIICNVNMIGEGVDLPSVDTVIFMEPRMSSIGVVQNIGRGLRLSPKKDFCMVLVHPSMIKTTLLNLEAYDSRVRQPALYNSVNYAAGDLKYSVQGIVEMFKLYDSRDFNALQRFISTLREMQIYCATDYVNDVRTTDMLPIPKIEFADFEWSQLIPQQLVTYDLETTKSQILNLLKNKDIYHEVNSYDEFNKKFITVLKHDPKLQYNESLAEVFNYRMTRRRA